MHVLIVADGRSPTTRSWVRMVSQLGHRITLISTFHCGPVEGVEADLCMPVGFSSLVGSTAGSGNLKSPRSEVIRKVISSFRSFFLAGRHRLGPLTLNYYGPRFNRLVQQIKPDVVHALRIPFEGMLASHTPAGIPLIVSIWGNDLTLHASGSAMMDRLTRQTLLRTDALFADTNRDLRMAKDWGFDATRPGLVVPGGGGINLAEIRSAVASDPEGVVKDLLDLCDNDHNLVLNPRGFRTGSVRNDTFFDAIPLVLKRHPGVIFACAAMESQPEALRYVHRLNLEGNVILLPRLPQKGLWQLFNRSQMSISISQHDGTPNSLLEAMACDCFPIAGDLESIREWITPGVNGLLVEPDKPQALADAIFLALEDSGLRRRATAQNARLVAERASADLIREKIKDSYLAFGK